jgi:CHASE3 domain sensor protein
MSARMTAATGDLQWERRYRVFEPKLDAAIQEAMGLWPEVFISEAVSQTNLANIKLVDMENKAFDSVRQGDLDSATNILYSAEYEKQKKIYSSGMQQVTDSMQQRVHADVSRQKRIAITIIVLLVVLLVLALVVWLYALRTLNRYVVNVKPKDV